MEIIKYKKLKNGKYKLFYEDGEIILYEDVILNNNLLYDKKVDTKRLEKIINDNSYYECYNFALKYIETRLRTKKEINNYLTKKVFNTNIIDKVILELEKQGYLNENVYINAFINDKINLTNDGPYKIKRELLKLNISEIKIEEYLNSIDNQVWINKINKIIDKKIKLNTNLSLNMFKRKVSNDLFTYGYKNEDVIDCLNDIYFDDKKIFDKEYDKAYRKFSKKCKDDELNRHIKNYLINKGFNA